MPIDPERLLQLSAVMSSALGNNDIANGARLQAKQIADDADKKRAILTELALQKAKQLGGGNIDLKGTLLEGNPGAVAWMPTPSQAAATKAESDAALERATLDQENSPGPMRGVAPGMQGPPAPGPSLYEREAAQRLKEAELEFTSGGSKRKYEEGQKTVEFGRQKQLKDEAEKNQLLMERERTSGLFNRLETARKDRVTRAQSMAEKLALESAQHDPAYQEAARVLNNPNIKNLDAFGRLPPEIAAKQNEARAVQQQIVDRLTKYFSMAVDANVKAADPIAGGE